MRRFTYNHSETRVCQAHGTIRGEEAKERVRQIPEVISTQTHTRDDAEIESRRCHRQPGSGGSKVESRAVRGREGSMSVATMVQTDSCPQECQ